jgi:hypothetical protein
MSSRLTSSAVILLSILALGPGLSAQQRPNPNSVQVGVPEGGAADQARARQLQQQAAAERARLAALPAPRDAQGHIIIDTSPTLKGVWVPGPVVPNPTATIPYQPWSKALVAARRESPLEPHTRCKASGGMRQFLTPYGVEIVDLPDTQRVYIFDIGGPHTYRTIYMDGRTHPAHVDPSPYGHSIGWWEGDTLVVDTIGFNENFWIDRGQTPTTDRLHTIERLTRTSLGEMKYEITFDDPGAYTAPFTRAITLRWENGTELYEYVCQEGNLAPLLMEGQGHVVGVSSPITP